MRPTLACGRKTGLAVLGAAVVWLVGYVSLSLAAPPDEELCGRAVQWFDYDGMHYWVQNRNERLIRIVRDLRLRALPADDILICSGEGWYGRTLHVLLYFNPETFVEERRGLAVHLEFLREAPDDIVGLALRHEVGHLVHDHVRQICFNPYDDSVAMRCEQEADDAAAAIVGSCEVARMLSWMVDYFERHNVSIYRRNLVLRIQHQMEAANCPAAGAPDLPHP